MCQPKRSIVYIDGFNLYYGALQGSPNKWLDLQLYFTRLRQDDEIQRIYYFTARVGGSAQQRQATFLRALATLPLVEVRLGRFKRKELTCRVNACNYQGPRDFKTMEEKQTDVGIAVQMLEDAYENNCDRFVIVSADSDLLPAVHKLKTLCPEKQIIVYIPARHRSRGAASELRGAADKDRTLPQELLKRSQFAATIPDGYGGTIAKPAAW